MTRRTKKKRRRKKKIEGRMKMRKKRIQPTPLVVEVCRLAVPKQPQVLLAPQQSSVHCPFE
jgi:hypothetical protein